MQMLAGADTTASTIRAIVYHVLKNPRVHKILKAALKDAGLSAPVAYTMATKIPYLAATIQEAMRVTPAVGLPLERVVPANGLTLPSGKVLPAGTVVGMNAWVVHMNEERFGSEPETFKPERWLRQDEESEGGYAARLRRMQDADLTFGAGHRACYGKHVALLQVYKLVATLFLQFEVCSATNSTFFYITEETSDGMLTVR
jgi:cytochrome P450